MLPTLFEDERNCAIRCLRPDFPLNMWMINYRAAIKNLVPKVRTYSLTLRLYVIRVSYVPKKFGLTVMRKRMAQSTPTM